MPSPASNPSQKPSPSPRRIADTTPSAGCGFWLSSPTMSCERTGQFTAKSTSTARIATRSYSRFQRPFFLNLSTGVCCAKGCPSRPSSSRSSTPIPPESPGSIPITRLMLPTPAPGACSPPGSPPQGAADCSTDELDTSDRLAAQPESAAGSTAPKPLDEPAESDRHTPSSHSRTPSAHSAHPSTTSRQSGDPTDPRMPRNELHPSENLGTATSPRLSSLLAPLLPRGLELRGIHTCQVMRRAVGVERDTLLLRRPPPLELGLAAVPLAAAHRVKAVSRRLQLGAARRIWHPSPSLPRAPRAGPA